MGRGRGGASEAPAAARPTRKRLERLEPSWRPRKPGPHPLVRPAPTATAASSLRLRVAPSSGGNGPRCLFLRPWRRRRDVGVCRGMMPGFARGGKRLIMSTHAYSGPPSHHDSGEIMCVHCPPAIGIACATCCCMILRWSAEDRCGQCVSPPRPVIWAGRRGPSVSARRRATPDFRPASGRKPQKREPARSGRPEPPARAIRPAGSA